jgi:hypothetical protein
MKSADDDRVQGARRAPRIRWARSTHHPHRSCQRRASNPRSTTVTAIPSDLRFGNEIADAGETTAPRLLGCHHPDVVALTVRRRIGSPLSVEYTGAKADQRFRTGYAQSEAERAVDRITFTAALPRLTPRNELERKHRMMAGHSGKRPQSQCACVDQANTARPWTRF